MCFSGRLDTARRRKERSTLSSQSTTTRVTTRRFVGSATPTIGFFPYGLLGLLLIAGALLYGVTLFANSTIEADVERSVRDSLRADFPWVDVSVDGQNVTLSGQGSELDGAAAIEVARRAPGATWLGSLTSPIDVTGEFETIEPAVEPEPVWADTRAQLAGGVLTLRGEVADDEERGALVSLANTLLDPPRLVSVVDELTLASGVVRPGSFALARRGVQSAAHCKTGYAQVQAGTYSLRCTVDGDGEETLRALAEAPVDEGTLGEVFVTVDESARCDQSFAELLHDRQIQFAVSRANLRASSRSLLDAIAEVAATCPGQLRVEGHTDARGNIEANMTLSRERADSVVDALVQRGLERTRLSAEGFGPNRPRAEGDSPEAHALNRRIEFHLVPVELPAAPEGDE